MASPTKLAHVVLFTGQLDRMRDWYLSVLDARVVHENPAAVFLTYDEEHHRIAFADPVLAAALAESLGASAKGLVGAADADRSEAAPPAGTRPLQGLAHVAFAYGSVEALLENYDRLRASSIIPQASINHGTTTSMYYADPDGNQVELQVDNFDTAEQGTAFMESESFMNNPVGVPFDPDELLERIRAGEPGRELVSPRW